MTSQKQISLFTEDESTCLQEDSHVNLSASPENNLERKMIDTSGRKCLELFERSPRSGAFSKTFAALLIGQGDWYSSRCRLTWKLKGTKSSRLYFQLVPSMLPTDGIGFGLLPTPCVADTEGAPKREDQISLKNGRFIRTSDNTGTEFGAKLNDVARLLKTPCTADAYSENLSKMEQKFGNSGTLAQEVQSGFVYQRGLLPTPKTQDCRHAMNDRGKSNLGEEIAQWAKEDGQISQHLSPLFTAEMMGFPTDWTVLPFLSGDKNR